MKIVIIDTYYPDALKTMPVGAGTYQEELEKVLSHQFGTADFYSRHLRSEEWEAIDIIANHADLQQLWARENGCKFGDYILSTQIEHHRPDVIFLQDFSLLRHPVMTLNLGDSLVAGQCSCPWPGDHIVKKLDIVFTSFPHYVRRIENLGVKAIYNPLAFEPSVLTGEHQREIDVAFVGGVGTPSHWSAGMRLLEKVAEKIPTADFYGYGYGLLPATSAVRKRYRGPAWGRDMYAIFQRSKIVINRHGEVAGEYANNMRMYEATGCGALLITDRKSNMRDLFNFNEVVEYDNPPDAVAKIQYYLSHWDDVGKNIAAMGQRRTLRDHTYEKRMKTVSEILKTCLN